MNERGFMPFSAAGVVIVLLVVAMAGQAVWSRHQRSLNVVDDASATALLTLATSVQNDLRAVARHAVYRALWEVSKDADNFDDNAARERAIERLATRYFMEQVVALENLYTRHDARVELRLPSSGAWPPIELKEAEGGYAIARAGLPKGTSIKISSWDNSLVVELSCEDFEVFIDSRYFLLQRKMQQFIDGLGSVGASWMVMEYISAWAGAWLKGNVTLNTSRSKAFFELAWAGHELGTFGSADYAAVVLGLIDATTGTSETVNSVLSELSNPTLTITPVRAADVEMMKEYLDSALDELAGASGALAEAEKHAQSANVTLAKIPENMDNADSTLENVRTALGGAIASVVQARNHVLEAGQHFEQLINFTARSVDQNVVMGVLYESLVGRMRWDYPSPQEQVTWGVWSTLAKLDNLKTNISASAQEMHAKHTIAELENLMTNLLGEITSSAQGLLAEPVPKRWVEFDDYAEPGSYDGDPPEPTKGRAPVYIDGERDGTIGALKLILQNAKRNLGTLDALAETNEPRLDDNWCVEINEALKRKLELNPQELSNFCREGLYELLPLPPIHSQPGLSVFRDFRIKGVRYEREDPAGWFGSPTATPIPLWFIGVTLWWAQWDITLELEDGAIKIFDFDNPTLPLTHEAMGEEFIVHKPLAYRHGISNNKFNFRLVIISLRPFSIS